MPDYSGIDAGGAVITGLRRCEACQHLVPVDQWHYCAHGPALPPDWLRVA